MCLKGPRVKRIVKEIKFLSGLDQIRSKKRFPEITIYKIFEKNSGFLLKQRNRRKFEFLTLSSFLASI